MNPPFCLKPHKQPNKIIIIIIRLNNEKINNNRIYQQEIIKQYPIITNEVVLTYEM